MKTRTLGSHPGAIRFRFSIMVVLILILLIFFLNYVDDSGLEIERASMWQTKRTIDSSLTVVFATYAINRKLDGLNQLYGGNPFVFLEEYEMKPANYRGITTRATLAAETKRGGWYYLEDDREVVFVSRYSDEHHYFGLVLDFDDLNHSGAFEAGNDTFKRLAFVKKPG